MKEFEEAVLKVDLPEEKLKAGDVGTIVDTPADGKAFVVEFMTMKGDTVAVVTLERDQVRAIKKSELPHVRAYAS